MTTHLDELHALLAEQVFERLRRLCIQREGRDGTRVLSDVELEHQLKLESARIASMAELHYRERSIADAAKDRRTLVATILLAADTLDVVDHPDFISPPKEQQFRDVLRRTDEWLEYLESPARSGGGS